LVRSVAYALDPTAPALWLARDAGDAKVARVSMRILYVLPFVPWAIRVRSYHLIPQLGREHEIYLLCRATSAEEEAHAHEMEPHCRHVRCVRHSRPWLHGALRCALAMPTAIPLRMAYFASPEMRNAVHEAVAEFQPDVIYLERWRTLQYVPVDVQVPVVCDPTDSMVLYNQRLMQRGSWWERLIAAEEFVKFRKYEAKLASQADTIVFCSRVDLECVQNNAPSAHYALVPNGVDCETFFLKRQQEEEPNTIVFTGNFGYKPNRHAVLFFLKEIFPLIRKSVPNARFMAVGSGATRYLKNDLVVTPDLELVDFVPELRPYIAKATVAVAPITIGAGVSNKLGEAFATGTPVVATQMACGDLPVGDGEHLLIANEPPRFAEKVVRLLRDPELRNQIVARARTFVEEQYDWGVVSRSMEQIMTDLAKGTVAGKERLAASSV
jgi:glycosyltransferase involved in cell wall biosynthesis